MRAVTTGRVTIGRSNIKQSAVQFQSIHRIPHEKRRVASKRIHVYQIKEIPSQITLRHYSIRIEMRHYPSSFTLSETPLDARQVLRYNSPILFVRVVCEHEIGLGFDQVPERPNPATAESVENTEFEFGFLVERGGENAEVSGCGALVPEEGIALLEFMTPFGLVLGFEARPRLGEEFRARVLGNGNGNGNGVEEKRGRG